MPNSRPPSIDKPRSGSGDAAAGSFVGATRSGSAGRQTHGFDDPPGSGVTGAEVAAGGSYSHEVDAGAVAQRGHELGLESAAAAAKAKPGPVVKSTSPTKIPPAAAKARGLAAAPTRKRALHITIYDLLFAVLPCFAPLGEETWHACLLVQGP